MSTYEARAVADAKPKICLFCDDFRPDDRYSVQGVCAVENRPKHIGASCPRWRRETEHD